MNLKTAKRIRQALELRANRHTTYEPQQFNTKVAQIHNANGELELHRILITRPIRLKAGSPRRVYKTLKRLERTIGLDRVFAQLAAEIDAPPELVAVG